MIRILLFGFSVCSLFNCLWTSHIETEIKKSSRINFLEKVNNCGFKGEEHLVTTEDGYILKVFRVRYDEHFYDKYNPIILQHGLLTDSNFWILNNCEKSFPFQLAIEGYDVWVPNSRGTLYSLDHISVSNKTSKYWDFSWNEMAKYDIPAIFNHVLRKTQKEKVIYVGHSQGTAILFAAPTFNENIADKVEKFIALAPISRVNDIVGFFGTLRLLFRYQFFLEIAIGKYDYDPNSSGIKKVGQLMCPPKTEEACGSILFSISGYNAEQFDPSNIREVLDSSLSSTSSKNILHYYQGMGVDKFQLYDYGENENLNRYGTKFPAEYDLSKVTFPVHLIAGTGDWLAPIKNINWLEKNLPNPKEKIFLNKWTHLDLVIGRDAPTKVFTMIKNILGNEQDRLEKCNN